MEAIELVWFFVVDDGGKISDDLGLVEEKRVDVGLPELDKKAPIVDLMVGCCG